MVWSASESDLFCFIVKELKDRRTPHVNFFQWQKKGEDGMGKAGKRKEMVEDRSSERVLCEKVVCEQVVCEKVCVSCVEMVEDRSCERNTYERVVCERVVCELLCGMCGQRHLRQDHRERSWQLLVLAAKALLQTGCCRTVMKVDGLSRCLRQRVACHFRSSLIGI